ncbi:hypothetical protein PI124_g6707 [Phytophthora idaei]|nr:hypothetical protein PI124_g6707 [Phytophthora idaei]
MAYLTPNNAAEFWNRGFVLHHLRLEADEVHAALAEIQQLDYEPIFGDVYDERMDQFREQANITTLTPAVAAIHQRVEHLVSINDEWVVDETSWHALRSYPSEADQAVHRDFPNFEIALEQTSRRTVRLDADHFILFRGGLEHAGTGFTRFNARLHCYVRVLGVPQEPSSTEAVVFRSYLCRRCMQLTYSRAKLAEHRQICVMPGRYTCQLGGQMYAIRNSLNQHVRRRHRERHDQDVLSEGSVGGSASGDDA